MDTAHPHRPPRPSRPSLHVDVHAAVAGADSADSAGAAYVQHLYSLPVVDWVSMWMNTPDGYRLVRAMPEGSGASLGREHVLTEWAAASMPFSWRVADPSTEDVDLGPELVGGLVLLFAQENALLLAIHTIADDVADSEEIRCIQKALADLSVHMVARGGLTTSEVDGQIASLYPVDPAFLEAAAMGDSDFIQHILELCREELKLGRARLLAALVAEDTEGACFIAHKLRTTARTAGAEKLDAVLESVENGTRRGEMLNVDDAVLALRATIASISELLESR